jgi:hypothetical protein
VSANIIETAPLTGFAALATGKSGDIEVERAFLEQVECIYEVFCKKQRDYGRGNISKFGADGVMVRVSDKIERLINLSKRAEGTVGHAPINESVADTWLDIATYGVIGMMCRAGKWPS